MFETLFSIFSSEEDELKVLLKHLDKMLQNSHQNFNHALKVILKAENKDEVRDTLYKTDQEINRLEIEIRKGVVKHLSFKPGDQVAACLTLMSVAKDAERTGDFCKNIFQIADEYDRPFEKGRYITPLREVSDKINDLYADTRKAFMDCNEKLANNVIKKELDVGKKCDEFLKLLIKDNLPTDKAVCYTLLSRYFKRIACHLSNIATSVVNPVHLIDFFDEKHRVNKPDREADH